MSTDAGKSTCQVVALPGRDGQGSEILLRLDEIAEKASAYPVMVEPAAGGRAIFVGMVSVDNGTGNFDRVLPSSIGKISGVQVMDDDGSLRYRATFAAG